MPSLTYVVLTLIGGAMLPIQASINAAFSPRAGSPLWAASITALVMALAVAATALVALRLPLPRPGSLATAPLWMWTGGLFGGFLLAVGIAATPRLGAAAMIVCLITGQLLCSLALDRFGLLGLAQHPINLQRLLGVALLAGGVALVLR